MPSGGFQLRTHFQDGAEIPALYESIPLRIG